MKTYEINKARWRCVNAMAEDLHNLIFEANQEGLRGNKLISIDSFESPPGLEVIVSFRFEREASK